MSSDGRGRLEPGFGAVRVVTLAGAALNGFLHLAMYLVVLVPAARGAVDAASLPLKVAPFLLAIVFVLLASLPVRALLRPGQRVGIACIVLGVGYVALMLLVGTPASPGPLHALNLLLLPFKVASGALLLLLGVGINPMTARGWVPAPLDLLVVLYGVSLILGGWLTARSAARLTRPASGTGHS
ncbi:hypothetical protein ACE7GA_12680 [Roseomonas sp. CCTCC AB2023176]|uniref:hypothetical protein n=1 Tax=Roseomonas sp. CCTCC AB2023176 TaxID=3342640 RepID=UPI0035DEE19B